MVARVLTDKAATEVRNLPAVSLDQGPQEVQNLENFAEEAHLGDLPR